MLNHGHSLENRVVSDTVVNELVESISMYGRPGTHAWIGWSCDKRWRITIIDDDRHLPYTMDQLGAGNEEEEDSDRFLKTTWALAQLRPTRVLVFGDPFRRSKARPFYFKGMWHEIIS